MTNDKILKLEPGPELERLVAERVMGWRESSDFAIERETGDLLKIDLSDSILKGLWKWSPSRDIAAAMEVCEELRSRGLVCWRFESFEQGWAVECLGHSGIVWAETLPLAICRAALLAVMEEENDGFKRDI